MLCCWQSTHWYDVQHATNFRPLSWFILLWMVKIYRMSDDGLDWTRNRIRMRTVSAKLHLEYSQVQHCCEFVIAIKMYTRIALNKRLQNTVYKQLFFKQTNWFIFKNWNGFQIQAQLQFIRAQKEIWRNKMPRCSCNCRTNTCFEFSSVRKIVVYSLDWIRNTKKLRFYKFYQLSSFYSINSNCTFIAIDNYVWWF